MPLNIQTLFEVLQKFADEKQMRITVSEAAQSGFIAGAGAFAGALLGGPPGILLGMYIGLMCAFLSTGQQWRINCVANTLKHSIIIK